MKPRRKIHRRTGTQRINNFFFVSVTVKFESLYHKKLSFKSHCIQSWRRVLHKLAFIRAQTVSDGTDGVAVRGPDEVGQDGAGHGAQAARDWPHLHQNVIKEIC